MEFAICTFVRELVQPQLRPVKSQEIELVESMKEMIQSLIGSVDASLLDVNLTTDGKSCDPAMNKECCNASTQSLSQRFIQVKAVEMLFVVYLASLSQEARDELVKQSLKESEYDDTVLEQLMSEAAFISFAIETSDQSC